MSSLSESPLYNAGCEVSIRVGGGELQHVRGRVAAMIVRLLEYRDQLEREGAGHLTFHFKKDDLVVDRRYCEPAR